MLRKIKLFTLAALLSLNVAVFALPAVAVHADSKTAVCEGVGLASDAAGCADPAGAPTIASIIRSVISLLSIIVGVVSVIMIIIGGLKYITSNGDASSISSAKNTIIYALVGLVVASLAGVMVRFVLSKIN